MAHSKKKITVFYDTLDMSRVDGWVSINHLALDPLFAQSCSQGRGKGHRGPAMWPAWTLKMEIADLLDDSDDSKKRKGGGGRRISLPSPAHFSTRVPNLSTATSTAW